MFSFDYALLVVVASILAAMGLATDNSVVIVAAMLVSPLMGPIVALTFGAVVGDWKIFVLGFFTELYGLCIALSVGFLMGIPLSLWGEAQGWGLPTFQMESRGTVDGLYQGIVIATASGVGMALSVLSVNNNVAALVGVAISAALLPPIVNSGMLFCEAIFGEFIGLSGTKDVNEPFLAELGG